MQKSNNYMHEITKFTHILPKFGANCKKFRPSNEISATKKDGQAAFFMSVFRRKYHYMC